MLVCLALMMPCAALLGGPGFFAIREAVLLPFALADRVDDSPMQRSEVQEVGAATHALGTAGAVLSSLTGAGLLPVGLLGSFWFAFAFMPLPAWTVLPALALVGAGHGSPAVLGGASGTWSDDFVYSSGVVNISSNDNATAAMAPFDLLGGRHWQASSPGAMLVSEPPARSRFFRLTGLTALTRGGAGAVAPADDGTFPAALSDGNGTVVAFLVGGEGAITGTQRC